MKRLATLIVILGFGNLAPALELPEPVLNLIGKYAAPTPAPCPVYPAQWRAIPNQLDIEMAFALTEKNGQCEFEFYNMGLKEAVQIPRDRLEHSLNDSEAASFAKIHSHPMGNVGYFAAGAPYNYEIMFADTELIATRTLPPQKLAKLADAVREGRIPGYSLSPPSVQDLNGASSLWSSTGTGPKRIVSKVISSGGVWTYAINDEAREKRLRSHLEYLVAFALQHEMATSGRAPYPRQQRARQLFEHALSDPEWKLLIESWRDTGFQLRAPYSVAATDAYLDHGNDELIQLEYQQKLKAADAFSKLMKGLGAEVSFEPWP